VGREPPKVDINKNKWTRVEVVFSGPVRIESDEEGFGRGFRKERERGRGTEHTFQLLVLVMSSCKICFSSPT